VLPGRIEPIIYIYIYVVIKGDLLDWLTQLEAGEPENPVAAQSKKLKVSEPERPMMQTQSKAKGLEAPKRLTSSWCESIESLRRLESDVH
jgi:hypothetical protein